MKTVNQYLKNKSKYDRELEEQSKKKPRIRTVREVAEENGIDLGVLKSEKSSKGFFKDSKAFDDGYHFGDITKTVVSTGGDLLTDIGEGFIGATEGVADWGQYRTADVLNFFGQKKAAEAVKKNAQFDSTAAIFGKNEKKEENFAKDWTKGIEENSISGDTLDTVMQGVGQVGAMAGMAYLGGGGGEVGATATKLQKASALARTSFVSYTSAYGNARSEAYKNGADDSTANKVGMINGFSEAIAEQFFNGLPGYKSAGWFSKVNGKIGGKIEKVFGTKIGRTFLKLSDTMGEGAEEMISNALNSLGTDIAHYIGKKTGKEYNYGMENLSGNALKDMVNSLTSEDSIESFFSAALTSALIGGGNTFLSNSQKNTILKEYAKENNITVQQAEKQLNATIESQMPNLPFEEKVEQQERIQKQELRNMKNGNFVSQEIDSETPNLPTDKKNQRFYYNDSKITDEYEKAVYESAKKTLNNSEETHKFVDKVAQIAKDKKTNYGFINNEELKTSGYNIEGKEIGGLVATDENGQKQILINIDSPKALNSIVGHETTHLLEGTKEYQELQQSIFEYAKQKGDFEGRQQTLSELYKDVENADINSEITADLVGDYLFTDEKFINSLSTNKPSLFQKIKDLIDDLIVRFKGTKEEKLLREVQKKFKAAYKQDGNLESNKYMMIGKNGAKNLSKNSNNNYYKNLNENLKKAQKKYNDNNDLEQENIKSKQKYQWFKTKYGDWGTFISDKESKLKQRLEPNHTYKLGEILDHDLLYKAYPELKNLKVETANIASTGGLAKTRFVPINTITDIVYLRNSDLNEKNFKYTLLHEINHYIEFKEKYNENSRGADSKTIGEEAYRNNLGELISNTTKMNANLTQEQLNDIILPEVAKKNPKYKNIKDELDKINELERKEAPKNDSKYANEAKEKQIQNNKKNSNKTIRQTDNNDRLKGIYDYEQNKFINNKDFYEELDDSSFFDAINSLKEKQNEIIQKTNPMLDDYHVGIRSTNDIRTWEEVLKLDDDIEGQFAWGDYTREEAEEALKNNKITIYSSNPIKNGTFISTSRIQAEEYAGGYGSKVYSKEVPLNEVAWINGDEGQYANVKESNSKTQYSLTTSTQDNQGRKLSEQQQEYFKDSKIRDENGNLMVMYHGTPNGDFTVFHPGSYFSPNQNYANNYQDENASILKQNKGTTNKKTYETYLNIKNPFELTNKQARDIYINEFIKGGNSEYFDPYTSYSDYVKQFSENDGFEWLEAEELREWVQENHPEYDGLVVQEVPDNVDPDAINLAYIPFNSNQIKNVDNTNPTIDDDIRYSLPNDDTKQYGNYNVYGEDIKYQKPSEANLPMIGKSGVLTDDDYKEKEDELLNKFTNKISDKVIKQTEEIAKRNLELKKKDTTELKTLIDNYKNMTKEEIYKSDAKTKINEFVRNHASQEFQEEIFDDELSSLQKEIKNTKFIIDEKYKSEFPDGITAFKKLNPGLNIVFGKNSNIDSRYQELAENYKGRLSEDATAGDIPYILADILNEETKLSNTISYELNNDEIEQISNKIYFGLTNNSVSKQDLDKYVSSIQDKIQNKYARQMAIQKYRDLAREQIGDITEIKDKKRGISYQTNTMKRNLRDIMSPEQAKRMYDTYFKTISENNAKIEIDKQSYVDRIQKLNLTDEESVYTQMLGEKKYNPKTTITQEQLTNYLDKHYNKIDTTKVDAAIEEFRNIYDELIVRVNDTLKANGYKPIDYRKGYFPHFIEDKPTSLLGKFAEKLGWKVNKGTLPTDIAGITEEFKPGKAWTSFSQKRTGDATDYNAMKGLDNYLNGAMDVIHHTEDIQKLRALESEIRYQYSDKGVQEKIDEIFEDQDLSAEEKYEQIALFTDHMKNNGLGNFATELRNYTNNLANKKSFHDRSMEQTLGRDTYSIMNNISSRVSANMVGANISSALTNFIPITQAWSQISTKNLMKGMAESIKASIKDDGFANNSVYLTNRTKQADKLYKTTIDKINDKLGIPFEAVDSFTSNTIVRAKYLDNIEKGMSEQAAMENADEFAKDVMAGRSKGDNPTIFNQKNPIAKLFTAFQLEVNNQFGYMFKDIKADLAGEAKDKLAAAFLKMFLGAWIYNYFSEKITGRKSAFSPIDMAIDDIKTATNENMDLGDKISTIATNKAKELPFVGGVMGGGRLPIQGAIPYENPLSMITSTISDVSDLFDEEKKDTAIRNLTKEWQKPLYYLGMPFGGGQIKKTIEGLSMYDENLPIAGSYTNAGKLRFEADDSTLGKLQAAVFGQYASKNAREYFENGYSPLSEKQINEALDANLPIDEYREINKGIKEAKATAKENEESQSEAEYDYIYNLPISMEQKNSLLNSKLGTGDEITDKNGYVKYKDSKDNIYWVDEESGTIYNNKYRESNINKDSLTKYSNKKDLTNYGDYGSLEEFNYANNNPTKYSVVKQITDYSSFKNYKDDIASIKQEYSDGTTRGSKIAKQQVYQYINSLNLNKYQKLMLEKMAGGYSIKNYKSEMRKYIESLSLTKEEKQAIDKELFG